MKKKRNKFMRFLAAALVLAMVIACGYVPETVQAASSGKVKSVTVTNLLSDTLTMKKGKTATLKVSVEGTTKKKVSQKVTYKSNKPKVVTVDDKGKLTAKKKGTAKITITSQANKKKKAVVTVTVGTPVTKVKLSKSTSTLEVGKKLTLKASVTPKKPSNKNIVWSTSNPKVATVTKKGVVKAVKAGTAKITATAADGSGKKATCKVKVSQPVGLSAVTVYNTKVLQVSLSGAKALTASNFVLKSKVYDDGTFNRSLGIESVTTSNKKDYTITLDSDSSIYIGETVQVTVSALSGTKTLSTKYLKPAATYSSESVVVLTYNEEVSRSYSVDGYGYISLTSVRGLPSGVTAKAEGDYIRFSGKPTAKGSYTVSLSVKDERGNVYNRTVYMLVAAQDKVVAASTPVYEMMGTDSAYIDHRVYASGGSGSYKYEIVGNANGLTMNGSYLEGTIKSAGTYRINVKVSDANNENLSTTTTVVLNIKQGITIAGIIKDASGMAIPYAGVYFTNRDETDRYFTSGYAYTDSKGAYSAIITAGTYDVRVAAGNGISYTVNQKYTASKSGVDFKVDVYKIAVVSSDAAVASSSFDDWYDAEGSCVGNGDVLYLKAGSYKLTSSDSFFLGTYTASVNINVTKAATVTATVTKTMASVGTIKEEEKISLTATSSYQYYAFTPSESGTYYFYSEGSCDAVGILQNASGSSLASDDDSGLDSNFYFTYNCTAGTTYYVGIKSYSGSGTSTLQVSKNQPSFDSNDDYEE